MRSRYKNHICTNIKETSPEIKVNVCIVCRCVCVTSVTVEISSKNKCGGKHIASMKIIKANFSGKLRKRLLSEHTPFPTQKYYSTTLQ